MIVEDYDYDKFLALIYTHFDSCNRSPCESCDNLIIHSFHTYLGKAGRA